MNERLRTLRGVWELRFLRHSEMLEVEGGIQIGCLIRLEIGEGE